MEKGFYILDLIFSSLLLVNAIQEGDLSKPNLHKIIEGHNLNVTCHAQQTPDVQVFWVKNDTTTKFRQNGTELLINYIYRTATGSYLCYSLNLTAVSADPKLLETIMVDVLYPAEISEFSVNPHLVMAKTPFYIHCAFRGNPDPDMTIMNVYSKRVLMSSRGSGNVTFGSGDSRCEDAGKWVCTGRNYLNIGGNVTRSGNATVLCAPHPKYDDMEGKYKVKVHLGQTAPLMMTNLGNPMPTHIWSHNGNILHPSINMGMLSILYVVNVQLNDFGTYTLNMTNDFGTYVATYELIPYGSPQAPWDLTYSEVTENSVRLHWKSGYDMGSRQHFVIYRVFNDIARKYSDKIYDYSPDHGVHDSFTHVVENLDADTFYKFSVGARNGHGTEVFSNNTEFWTKAATTSPTEPINITSHINIWIYVGAGIGGVILLSLLAILAYRLKNRASDRPLMAMDYGSKSTPRY